MSRDAAVAGQEAGQEAGHDGRTILLLDAMQVRGSIYLEHSIAITETMVRFVLSSIQDIPNNDKYHLHKSVTFLNALLAKIQTNDIIIR